MAFLPVVGAVVSAVGTAVSAIGAGNAANYQAQVANNNAQIAQNNAKYATAAGQQKAEEESLKQSQALGAIKARTAANNVDVNTGSAVDVQASQRETGELDAETVLNNAELQAYGYRSQATSFEAQAGLDEMQASEAPVAGLFNTVGNLASKASSVGGAFNFGVS